MGKDKGEGRSRTHTRAETGEVMVDRTGWRWYFQGGQKRENEFRRSFFRFIKQKPVKQWFSNASSRTALGLCMDTGGFWRDIFWGRVRRACV